MVALVKEHSGQDCFGWTMKTNVGEVKNCHMTAKKQTNFICDKD